MSEPSQSADRKQIIRPGFLMGVVCVFITLLVLGGVFALGHYCANCHDPGFGGGSAEMGAEAFVAEITDFYELIISILFGVIGVVLAIAVTYVHMVSKQQARDMATEALDSSSFRAELQHKLDEMETKLKELVKDTWIDVKNSSDFEEIRAAQGELQGLLKKLLKRVKYVEEVMNVYTSADDKTGLSLEEPPATDGD